MLTFGRFRYGWLLLQNGNRTADDSLFMAVGGQVNAVGVNASAKDFTANVAVPFEVRVFRSENYAAPTVEDVDFEDGDSFGGRKFEDVVDTVVVGRGDGVGKVDIERTNVANGSFSSAGTAVLGYGDGVCASLGDSQVLCVCTGAPLVFAIRGGYG